MTTRLKTTKRSEYDRVYDALLTKLKREKFPSPGTLATFYLDVFVRGTKRMEADEVYALGLTEWNDAKNKSDNFTEWREKQKTLGYITYEVQMMGNGKPRWIHRPGKKLVSYINRVKVAEEEIATKKELSKVENKVEERMEALESRVENLEGLLRVLVDKYDHPVTSEKMTFYTQYPLKLVTTIQKSH